MKSELGQLIEEQQEDSASRIVKKNYKERTFSPKKLIEIADALQVKHCRKERITWGKPARRAEVREQIKIHGVCPKCGATRPEDFDYFDNKEGFGSWCPCGFTI